MDVRLVAYHAAIHVRDMDGGTAIIRCDLPDFVLDRDLARLLAAKFGVRTFGELVVAVGSVGLDDDSLPGLCSNLSVERGGEPAWDVVRFGWDELI